MVSRAILLRLRGTSTVKNFLRTKTSSTTMPDNELQSKLTFFNPFKDPKDDPCIERIINPCDEIEKDTDVKKEIPICVEIKPPCEEKKINKCSGGSDGPPKGPDIPIRKRPEFPGKVRLGFIPEEWFQFFYPKTGVTGPYVFGVGLFTYLASKEIYVMEHEFYSGLSFAILMVLLINKLGPPTAAYVDKLSDEQELYWEKMHKNDIDEMKKKIEHERKEQWRAEGALQLVEAKREMIDMQLEAAYREKIMEVYKEIVQRLDYQVACSNVEQRLSHRHMMFWLHDQVAKAIKDEQVDETQREKIKADLSAMVIRIKDFETASDIKAGSSFNKPT